MKKIILLIGCLSLLAVGIISVSCSKDDEWNGCKCTYKYEGETETETITLADLKEYELDSYIKSCSQMEDFFDEYDEYFGEIDNVKCVDL
ncbi:MAG: hypothetical protein LBS69_05425 [Prevotellaceae bacterium]|nr:hypothetical protein [Prevotellaceae bacterium]